MSKLDQSTAQVLARHYKKAISEPDEYIKYWMDPANPAKWWCILHNMMGQEDVLQGGEYLVEVTAPPDFPHNPPSFLLHTPNGVYGMDKPVCISIGHYHSNAYPAALGMRGFITEIVNGMICQKELGGGINVLPFNTTKIKAFATTSRAYNLEKYPRITRAIEEAYEEYKLLWNKPKAPEESAKPKATGLGTLFKRKAKAAPAEAATGNNT